MKFKKASADKANKSSKNKANHTEIKSGSIFCPSVSMATVRAAGEAISLYMYLRCDFHSFVYQDRSAGGEYDNTLTCYYQTDEAIQKKADIPVKRYNKYMNILVDAGLVVKLPFTKVNQDGISRERRNLVVLDLELTDYLPILKECADRLEGFIAGNRRAAKAKKQLDIICDIMPTQEDKTQQEADSWEDEQPTQTQVNSTELETALDSTEGLSWLQDESYRETTDYLSPHYNPDDIEDDNSW